MSLTEKKIEQFWFMTEKRIKCKFTLDTLYCHLNGYPTKEFVIHSICESCLCFLNISISIFILHNKVNKMFDSEVSICH